MNRPDKTFQWFGVTWGTPFVLAGQYLIWGRFVYSAGKSGEPITLSPIAVHSSWRMVFGAAPRLARTLRN